MKKLFKILFVFITVFLFSNIVLASDNTCERTEKNNYGVTKFDVTSKNKENVLNTPCVDAKEKIYDYADILTSSEESNLKKLVDDFIKKYNTDLIIVTIDMPYTNDSQNENYASNFYDYNDFGVDYEKYDGIVLLRNAWKSDPYYDMYTFGNAQLYFSQSRYNSILDGMLQSFKNKKYFLGMSKFVSDVERYYKEGIDPTYTDYYVDSNGYLKKKQNGKDDSNTTQSANVETCNRNEKKNYGVNKKFEITSNNKGNVLNTPCVDASKKIYDFAGILTDAEEQQLYDLAMDFIKKYDTEVVIVTINMPYSVDSQNEDYAADFYDYNDFGIDYEKYDGILLLRNAYSADPYYDMYTFGNAQLYFSQKRYDYILDSIYPNMKSKNYLTAMTQYIGYLNYYYEQGKDSYYINYYVDENGFLRKRYIPPIPLALFIAVAVTVITMAILKSKNKMVKKAYEASEYIDKSSINYRRKEDKFDSTHTSRIYSPVTSSSSGGHSGGGSHSGSSGGGHSSGGGRHG